MAAKSPFVSRTVHVLVFGGLAIMGGMLALAQISGQPTTPQRGGTVPAPQKSPSATAQNQNATTPGSQQRSGTVAAPENQNAAAPASQRETSRRQGLGIQFNQQTQNGLTIAAVQPDSLAAEAGLQAGDRIVTIDGQSFTSPRQLQAYLGGQYGRQVPVMVDRGGRQTTVQLRLNEPQGDVAWLGVFLNDNQENERGAIVAQVFPSGPAARAGVQTGDVIQQVNGQQVATSADLIAEIEEMQPGAKVELSLLRNNEPAKLTAVLGSRDNFVFRSADHHSGGRGGEFNDDYNIPAYAMELEHNRRMAEQHQRIEVELAKLRDEVRLLREALQKR